MICLVVCVVCIVCVYKGEGGKIEISGIPGSALTCMAVGAIGLWTLFQLSESSVPYCVLYAVFIAAGGVLLGWAIKTGVWKKDIKFAGPAAVAVIFGVIGMYMLFVWSGQPAT
jgi:hypothetical protein